MISYIESIRIFNLKVKWNVDVFVRSNMEGNLEDNITRLFPACSGRVCTFDEMDMIQYIGNIYGRFESIPTGEMESMACTTIKYPIRSRVCRLIEIEQSCFVDGNIFRVAVRKSGSVRRLGIDEPILRLVVDVSDNRKSLIMIKVGCRSVSARFQEAPGERTRTNSMNY